MSLTSFLQLKDVAARLKPLRPKLPRKIAVPLQVEPRSNHSSLVGTAFDYLVRFELQRLAPHVVAQQWAAEYAPDTIWQETTLSSGAKVESFRSIFTDDLGRVCNAQDSAGDPELAKELAQRASSVLNQARSAVSAHLSNPLPTRAQQAELAAHAIRVAKVHGIQHVSRFNPGFEDADPEDVADLLAMLAIVPFDALLHDKVMMLDPGFLESSALIDGAHADLITGDMLVDFKTSKKGEITTAQLDQLVGYYLLARHRRRADPGFPAINRLALYFSRHRHLWSLAATNWTDHPHFADIEAWFFERAQEVFGSKPVQPAGSALLGPAASSGDRFGTLEVVGASSHSGPFQIHHQDNTR